MKPRRPWPQPTSTMTTGATSPGSHGTCGVALRGEDGRLQHTAVASDTGADTRFLSFSGTQMRGQAVAAQAGNRPRQISPKAARPCWEGACTTPQPIQPLKRGQGEGAGEEALESGRGATDSPAAAFRSPRPVSGRRQNHVRVATRNVAVGRNKVGNHCLAPALGAHLLVEGVLQRPQSRLWQRLILAELDMRGRNLPCVLLRELSRMRHNAPRHAPWCAGGGGPGHLGRSRRPGSAS